MQMSHFRVTYISMHVAANINSGYAVKKHRDTQSANTSAKFAIQKEISQSAFGLTNAVTQGKSTV